MVNITIQKPTLLLDRQHRVRYAVYGAFVWDSPEVIEVISRLLDGN